MAHWLLTLCAATGTAPELPYSALSYNVLYAGAEHHRSVELIDEANPDIVCLREVTKAFVQVFNRRLKRRYPHRRFRPKQGTWGLGIASRFVIERFRSFPIKPHRIPGAEARIRTPDGSIVLVCIHLMPPGAKHRASDGFLESMKKNRKLRAKQARFLARSYESKKRPVLMLGDFNEGPQGSGLDWLRKRGFENACRGLRANCGATWPGDITFWPALFQVDHVLGRGLIFSDAKVLRGGGSDHLAVHTKFGLRSHLRRPD